MIAADTSSIIAFFEGDTGRDVEKMADLLQARLVFLPPPVLSELLSDPKLGAELENILLQFPLLETFEGIWYRAGKLRASALKKGKKTRLGDALIAQYCLDHKAPLITRDRDFKAFEPMQLKLLN